MNFSSIFQAANFLKAAVLLSIIAVCFAVSRSSLIVSHPQINLGITLDLTLTLPFAYLFFIRKTKISKLTAIPVFIFGLFFASFILPQENSLLHILRLFVFPALEIGVLGFAGYTIFRARKTYKSFDEKNSDTMENLRQTLAVEFPSPALGRAAAFEIAVLYYAFFKWRGEKPEENLFTYHRETGVLALLSIFIFLVLAETVALHLIIANWNAVAAWILTALSVYFALQIFAHGKAVLLRPIKLGENDIMVRCGIIGDAQIAYEKIKEIETIKPPFEDETDAIKLTAARKLTAPNVKITLREAEILNGFYGVEKKFKTILLAVDQAEKFKAAIENKLADKN